jgi:hypothetical protein
MEEKERSLGTADLASAADTSRSQSTDTELEPEEREDDRLDVGPAGHEPEKDMPRSSAEESLGPLLGEGEAISYRERWIAVQTRFVDEPRESVAAADGLVAEVMKRLAETFAAERADLETQWDRGDEVSTEDLRQAMRRYRSFFERLLSA